MSQVTRPRLERGGLAADDELTMQALITRGVALSNIGRSTEATVILTGAKAFAERRGMVGSSLRATTNLGYALEPEDPVLGFQVSKEGYDRAVRYGVVWAVRYLLGNAADAAFQAGEWDWALCEVNQQLSQDLEVREKIWFGTASWLFRACRGETEQARAERVGATPFAARVDEALGRAPVSAPHEEVRAAVGPSELERQREEITAEPA